MMCLGVGLFASILFGTLCASWTCKSISFTKLGKFSFLIFSKRFPISCSFSSPSGTPMMWMLEYFKVFQKLLPLSLFFWILFISYTSNWLFLPGVGLGLFTPEISLLNFYPPHMDVGPAHSVSLPLLDRWSYQSGWMWFLEFCICQTSIQLDFWQF